MMLDKSTRRELAGSQKTCEKISLGYLTTKAYRAWCVENDVTQMDGVFYPGHPLIFPIRKPMKCKVCGWVAETARLEEDDSWACTMKERRGPDAEPAEYEQICVECAARDSFEPAPVCDECLDYPCTCSTED